MGDLCDSEYSEPALAPCAMLLQQEGEEHEETPVVDNPPDVNVALAIIMVIHVNYGHDNDDKGGLPKKTVFFGNFSQNGGGVIWKGFPYPLQPIP